MKVLDDIEFKCLINTERSRLERDYLKYQRHNIRILYEIDNEVLYQLEGSTECKCASLTDLKKKGKPFTGSVLGFPDIPVEFISYEGEDIVYHLCCRQFKVKSNLFKIQENLKLGDIFILGILYVRGSDLN